MIARRATRGNSVHCICRYSSPWLNNGLIFTSIIAWAWRRCFSDSRNHPRLLGSDFRFVSGRGTVRRSRNPARSFFYNTRRAGGRSASCWCLWNWCGWERSLRSNWKSLSSTSVWHVRGTWCLYPWRKNRWPFDFPIFICSQKLRIILLGRVLIRDYSIVATARAETGLIGQLHTTIWAALHNFLSLSRSFLSVCLSWLLLEASRYKSALLVAVNVSSFISFMDIQLSLLAISGFLLFNAGILYTIYPFPGNRYRKTVFF
jgi:hypothetical protein